MHRKKIHLLILAIGFLVSTTFAVAADAPSGAAEKAAKEAAKAAAIAAPPADEAMLANTCAGCHGTNGVSGGPAMPSIAGMPSAYLITIMEDFKSGKRPSTIMGRIAQGYTEEETKRISDFLAKTTWVNSESHPNSQLVTQIDVAKAKKGEKLVKENKCEKCHEDDGITQDGETPRMAGQWLDYLLIKMQDYKNPSAETLQPKKMKTKIDELSLEDLESIAHFYANASR